MEAYNAGGYVSVYLAGQEYPASTTDLIYTAKVNGAPTEFINLLASMPNYLFYSERDVYATVIQNVQVSSFEVI